MDPSSIEWTLQVVKGAAAVVVVDRRILRCMILADLSSYTLTEHALSVGDMDHILLTNRGWIIGRALAFTLGVVCSNP
jgi:hypothetical protein